VTYQIKIIKSGKIIRTVEGIEAQSALEAIDRIEAKYKSKSVQLSGRNGAVHSFEWTGLEFQARRLDFVLS
jgi:hypothetical protein